MCELYLFFLFFLCSYLTWSSLRFNARSHAYATKQRHDPLRYAHYALCHIWCLLRATYLCVQEFFACTHYMYSWWCLFLCAERRRVSSARNCVLLPTFFQFQSCYLLTFFGVAIGKFLYPPRRMRGGECLTWKLFIIFRTPRRFRRAFVSTAGCRMDMELVYNIIFLRADDKFRDPIDLSTGTGAFSRAKQKSKILRY